MCWKRFCGFSTQVRNGTCSQSYPNCKTVHRRFQTWCCHEILRLVLTDVANELRENGALNEEECFLSMRRSLWPKVQGRRNQDERSAEEGMKIMAIVDSHALPALVSTAQRRTITKSVWCSYALDFYMIEAKPGEFDRRSRLQQRSAG